MKLSRLSAVLAAGCFGCTGQIRGSTNGSPEGVGPTMVPSGIPSTKPPVVDVDECNASTLGKPRVWRLTNEQIKNSLIDTVGFLPPSIDTLPAETRLEGFANQSSRLTIAPLLADYYFKVSDEIGAEVVKRSGEFLECPTAALGTGSCLSDFVKSFGAKMWRRPPTDAEVARFTTLYMGTASAAGGPEAGLKNVVQGLVMSPNFLYRTEVGNTQDAGKVTYLTDYELASALSYMLWDSVPDQALYDLAAQGKLRDRTVLVGEAKRMWAASKKTPPALHSFLKQWLQIENLLDADKDQMVYSVYDKQVAADLLDETSLFLNSVVFDQGGDRSFKTLFTADYGFVNNRTAPIYGATVPGANLTRTTLNGAQRKGLLTLGAFMAAHADGDDTGLVSRGRYFREEILCDGVPPPNPVDAMFDPAKITEDMTNRERLQAHSTAPACAVCHVLFDGLGFAMENYDPIGRWRTTDKNKPVDPTGSVPLKSGPTLEFKNFVDLVGQLAKTTDLYSCFGAQYLSYATGRKIGEINECEKKLVVSEFTKADYKIDALVFSVVNSPSFMARKN